MPRVLVIHFDAEAAAGRLRTLREAGIEAEHLAVRSSADLTALRDHLPDAFLVDLSRVPSQGRDIGSFLRRQKATRHVPLVFAGGEPDKVAKTRKLLPDATFCEWDGIREAIAQALAAQPERPVVRDAMAGYSGTPLPKKLGIQPGTAVILAGAPEGFARLLEPLPANVQLKTALRGQARLVLLFVKSGRDLEARFPAAARAVEERGGLWIAWPKKASGIASDLSEAAVRKFGLARAFVDYKICAIDATWSGLLFARRRG